MILLFCGLCALSVVLYTLITGISPAPTSGVVREALLEQLPKQIAGPVYELGCGFGGLACALAKRYPEGKIIAFELSPLPFLVARLRALWIPNLTVIRADFLKRPLTDASLAICYLCPKLMEQLKPKLQEELVPGAWVASHTFAIRGWDALRETRAPDLAKTPVYLYVPN